jgi:hypothetical protein
MALPPNAKTKDILEKGELGGQQRSGAPPRFLAAVPDLGRLIVGMVMSAFVEDGALWRVLRLFDPDATALAAVAPARGQRSLSAPLR